MAVGKAGERIVVGKLRELFLVLLLFSHVIVCASDFKRVAVRVPFADAPAIQHQVIVPFFILHAVQCFWRKGFPAGGHRTLPVPAVYRPGGDVRARPQTVRSALWLIAEH